MAAPAKLYRMIPERTPQGGFRVLVDQGHGNIKPLSPSPSQRLYNHSPNGFNWGYGGSGPAQLSLALLLDVTKSDDVALRYYQKFKWDVVARREMGKGWVISDGEIRGWLSKEVP